jgi:alkanesulfonate monooxygenase SsuD/methylene tetrahydromethanopterin reductase-like flavin-dependent oxidoreductase (luciferase family)
MQVGPLVLAVGFRPPALLGKMAATLHAWSGGRFIMGIGAGWREADYTSYGYPFPRAAVRIRQLDEALEIFQRMWTAPIPTFQGDYFQVAAAYCAPPPNPPPPVMIGGAGEQLMLPLIARRADIWDCYHSGDHATVDHADYQRKRDLLHDHAAALGRDPATITLSLSLGAARLPQSSADSARWVASLQPLVELGVRQFILDCGHVSTAEPIHRFGEEVIAVINGASSGA